MGQDYSKLRCGFTADGQLKAERETGLANGGAIAATTVGAPDKFNSHAEIKHPPDLKLSNSVVDVNEKDIGGSNKGKSVLAGTAQDSLRECAKQFPSF